jgi:hypothetical protein
LEESNIEIPLVYKQLSKISAFFHDTVLDFEEINGKMVRPRNGENEKKSYELAWKYIDEINKKKPGTFSEGHKEEVKKAIMITVAGFDPQKGVINGLDDGKEHSFLETCIGLADISTVGMRDYDEFFREGRQLFQEEYLFITDSIESGDIKQEEKKENFKSEMLKFMKFQVSFAQKREKSFKNIKIYDENIKAPGERIHEILKEKLFNKFKENAKLADEKYEEIKNLPFKKVAEFMGYNLSRLN